MVSIYFYELTILNGFSLMALNSKEFTLCSGSFDWGGHLHARNMHCPRSSNGIQGMYGQLTREDLSLFYM